MLAESLQTIYARPVWSADDLTVNAGVERGALDNVYANCETGSLDGLHDQNPVGLGLQPDGIASWLLGNHLFSAKLN